MKFKAYITRSDQKRIICWLSPLTISGIFWLWAYLFPSEHMTLYALQAIALSAPSYVFLLWMIIGLCAWVWFKRWYFAFSFLALGFIGFPEPALEDGYSIVVVNVNAFAGDESTLQKELAARNSDVLIEIETRTRTIPNMTEAAFDHDLAHIRPSHLSAVFCRTSCSAAITGQIGSQHMKMPVALVRLPQEICLVGIHAPPPLPVDATGMQPYLDYLGTYIQSGKVSQRWEVCQKGDDVLLMGDLNAVQHSHPYKTITSLGLRDVRRYSGIWGATWPVRDFYSPLPVFRLDHVMAGPGIVLKSWKSFPIQGSDHRGLEIRL